MRQQRPHKYDTPYVEEDLGTVVAPLFSQAAAADGDGVVVSGPCPRCHGRTTKEYRRGVPGTGTKGVVEWLTGRRDVADEPEPLVGEVHFCECGYTHPGIPADALVIGCGAGWRIRP